MPYKQGDNQALKREKDSSILIPATLRKPLEGRKLHTTCLCRFLRKCATIFRPVSEAKEKKCPKTKHLPSSRRRQ